jgi:transcriptional regulator with XRE-family HTH domain
LRLKEDITEKLKRSAAAVLFQLRVDNQLTQIDLSEISGVGRTTITHLENAARIPSVDTLFLLASAFDMKPSELLELIDADFSRKKPTPRVKKSL